MMEKNRPKAAISLCGRVLKRDPGNVSALHRNGLALNRIKKYPDAVTCFDLILDRNPEDAPAHNSRGIAMAEMGNTQDAAECYDRAAADPRYAAPYFNRGSSDKLGEHEEALACMEKAIKTDPKRPNPLFYRGIILGKMNRYEGALNCFEVVCRRFPRHQDARFHKGIEQAELGDHRGAVRVFDGILERHRDNANVVYARARSLAAPGQDEAAMALLGEAVSKNPKTVRAWAREKIFARYHGTDRFRKMVRV